MRVDSGYAMQTEEFVFTDAKVKAYNVIVSKKQNSLEVAVSWSGEESVGMKRRIWL